MRLWALLLVLLLAGCGAAEREPAARVVEVTVARHGTLPQVTDLSGQVHAGRRASVSPSVGGRVLRVDAREGDTVVAGEPVVWLDPRQQEAQIGVQAAAVDAARAHLGQLQAQYEMTETGRLSDVEKAKESVKQADLEVQQAQARMQSAEVDMNRKKDLLASKAVARADYETAALNYQLSKDALATARSQAVQAREGLRLAQSTAGNRAVHQSDLDAAQAAVEQALASLEASRATLDQMVLSAPISGTVVNRQVQPGQTVQPGGAPLLEIVDRSGAYVSAVAAQSELGHLREGMEAEVRLAQTPEKPVRARIKNVIPATDPSTSTVRVLLTLDRPPLRVVDQSSASVRVRVGTREGILVPRRALQGDRKDLHVVVVREGQAHLAPVKVEMMNESTVLVASGISAGETVVVEGGQFLSAGDRVQVRQAKPKA